MDKSFYKKLLLLNISVKAWDESKHPRNDAGTSKGGEFSKIDSNKLQELDKEKADLLKRSDELSAKKKRLYSNMDIESAMSDDEKQLDKDIADTFSKINLIVLEKRKIKKVNN